MPSRGNSLPTSSDSMIRAVRPPRAARMAVISPAGPAPMTIKSSTFVEGAGRGKRWRFMVGWVLVEAAILRRWMWKKNEKGSLRL